MKNTLKSIGAVLAGFVTVFILSVVTDMLLEGIGFFPPQDKPALFTGWLLVIAFAYRSLYTFIGGYITAKLAPKNPMKLVTILGIIGTFAAILGVIGGWNLSAHWYPIALAVTGFPLIYYGGKFQCKK